MVRKMVRPPRTRSPFILLITGTPGTGKTTHAAFLGKKLNAKVISEKTFTRRMELGKMNALTKEFEVNLQAYADALIHLIGETEKNLIIEGHVACEMNIPVDLVIVLRCDSKVLEKRLRSRGYSEVKIYDNVMAEENGYCLMRVRKNYSPKKIIIVQTHTPKKVVRTTIWNKLTRRQGGRFA
ncbi:MAG: AAA family ATPase [Candidatus Diapherotrites archaeon]|nr:AAA family ATPase [Candidatus Diapherotrites archaeon]MDZ4256261.1 AAA family ATPase [archaeon]